MIDKTGDIARKEGSRRPKSVCTEENIELEEVVLSQKDLPGTLSTPAETSRVHNIDRLPVSRVIE